MAMKPDQTFSLNTIDLILILNMVVNFICYHLKTFIIHIGPSMMGLEIMQCIMTFTLTETRDIIDAGMVFSKQRWRG